MAHLCIAPACPVECMGCNHAISAETAMEYAKRYAWLRAQHWNTSPLVVVANPKHAVKLGHTCPTGNYLDDEIDAAMLPAA